MYRIACVSQAGNGFSAKASEKTNGQLLHDGGDAHLRRGLEGEHRVIALSIRR